MADLTVDQESQLLTIADSKRQELGRDLTTPEQIAIYASVVNNQPLDESVFTSELGASVAELIPGDTVGWREILGQSYKTKLEYGMLTEDGRTLEQNTRLVGGGKGKEYSKLRKVKYNRDYVIQKLIRDLVETLGQYCLTEDKFIELMKPLLREAFKVQRMGGKMKGQNEIKLEQMVDRQSQLQNRY